MSKILDWIKKHIWQTVLIGLGLFFLPLILVHVAYRIPAFSPWFSSIWEAGELITYIAGFEAFIGTLLLGLVTVNLNKKSVDLNKDLLRIEKARSLYESTPKINVIAKEMIPTTLHELLRMEIPYYSSRDLFVTRGRPASRSSRRVYLQKILITPISRCDVHASVKNINLLVFDVQGEDRRIEYDPLPEMFFPSVFQIHDEPYEINIIHDDLFPDASPEIIGEISIEFTNNVFYKFQLHIRFTLTVHYEQEIISSTTLKINSYFIDPVE